MRAIPLHDRGRTATRATAARVPGPRADAGFTLLELMATMSVFGVLAAISVNGLHGWSKAHEHSGTAAGIQSVLREAQQRAVTEGRATCVDFDVTAQTFAMYRGACDEAGRVQLQGPLRTNAAHVKIDAPSFTGPSGAASGVTFKPRGTAWAGSVKVIRNGSSKQYTLTVEGLTGRVSRA